jgi:GT2 family glycosyltransferase
VKYGYVCTNYNGSQFTADAVASLMSGEQPPARIVVVDNVSDAKNQDMLRALAQRYVAVHVIFNPQNVGYFRGLNVGIRMLHNVEPDLDAMVVGNNDLIFPPNFGPVLAQALTRVGHNPVLSPDITTLDGAHQNPHVIKPVGRLREIAYDIYHAHYYFSVLIQIVARLTRAISDRDDESQHAVAQYIRQGHGSAYILTRAFFDHFDELHAPTFLYGEEYFLAKQLEDKGMFTYYEPSVKIQHLYHASLQKLPSRRAWAFSRDAHKVYRKYVRGWRQPH